LFALNQTLAANISLDSGGPVEFGQGVARTSACDNQILVTPGSQFLNSVGSGTHVLSTIKISEIDSSEEHCANKDFKIKVYGSSGSALEMIPDYSEVQVTDNGSNFSLLSHTGVSISSPDNTEFTIHFSASASPINSSMIKTITVESLDHKIIVYNVGDVGPAGGTIIYKNLTGFSCGIAHASTCNYLEAAPKGWFSGTPN
jgi:hypothetical protein